MAREVNAVSLVVKIERLKGLVDPIVHPVIDEILEDVRLLVSEKRKREEQWSKVAASLAELGWLRELEEVGDGRSNT